MDPKRIVALVVGAAVMVLIFSAILVPIINDATTTEKTFQNEGAFYVEIDPATTYTVKYQQYDNPGKLIVNGEVMPITFNQGYTLLNLDNTILRLVSNNQMQLIGEGTWLSDVANLDITISNGTVSGTLAYGNPLVNISWPKTTYEHAFIISPTESDSVMKAYDTVSKMNAASPIKAYGVTTINGETNRTVLVDMVGDIENGVEVKLRDRQTSNVITTMTISDLEINYTEVSGYIDLYDLSTITFTVTNGDYTTDVTYSAFVVPAEVTAEMSVHPDAPTLSLLSVIPIIAMIGIVLAVVGVAIVGRYD